MPCSLIMGNNLIRTGRHLCGLRTEGGGQPKVTHLIHFFVFLILSGKVVKQLLGAEKEAQLSG